MATKNDHASLRNDTDSVAPVVGHDRDSRHNSEGDGTAAALAGTLAGAKNAASVQHAVQRRQEADGDKRRDADNQVSIRDGGDGGYRYGRQGKTVRIVGKN